MSIHRPSTLRRILNRIYPFPLVRAQDNRLAQLEATLAHMRASMDAMRSDVLKKVDGSRWHLRDFIDGKAAEPATLTCILCKHTAPTSSLKARTSECIFGGGPLVRHECSHCGAVFGPQKMLRLTPEELSFEYKELYGYYREADSTPSEVRAFHALKPRKGGVYLNYGAGAWSQSVAQLRQAGYTVYAYEPHVDIDSEFLINSESKLTKMRFDGIYSNNVIEHFDDPVKAFKLMASVLKGPESRMAHASPCYDYSVEFTRFHLIFFTGKSVEVLAKLSGLKTDGSERDTINGVTYICHHFLPQ